MASSSSEVRKEDVVATYRTARRPARRRRDFMTVEEYLETPKTVQPQELIYGVPRAAEAPLPPHQRAVANLFLALHGHVADRHLGEVWLSPIDVILDGDRHLV